MGGRKIGTVAQGLSQAVLMRGYAIAQERQGTFAQLAQQPVSYTHLDVYKRQALNWSRMEESKA